MGMTCDEIASAVAMQKAEREAGLERVTVEQLAKAFEVSEFKAELAVARLGHLFRRRA